MLSMNAALTESVRTFSQLDRQFLTVLGENFFSNRKRLVFIDLRVRRKSQLGKLA